MALARGFIFLGLALLFSLLGFSLRQGRGTHFVVGSAKSSETQRDPQEEQLLGRYLGFALYGFAISWVVAAFGAFLTLWWLSLAGVVLFLMTAAVTLLWMKLRKRFRR